MNGIDLIKQERQRQVESEGYSAAHDDEHTSGEIALAAACYAAPEPVFLHREAEIPFFINDGDRGDRQPLPERYIDAWPWEPGADKREKHDRLRRLTIAGALIAAEIDRILRAQGETEALAESGII